MTFTKLFSSITESTIWQEDDKTRLVWITMLAMADRQGRVWASIPGLAHRARVPLHACRTALRKLAAPDKDSRTPDHQGRRIEAIDGGWILLNHAKYREIRDHEAILESKRRYINTRRAVERVEKASTVDRSRDNAEADPEADPDKGEGESPHSSAKNQGNGRSLTAQMLTLKDARAVIHERTEWLKNRHCCSGHWDNEDAEKEFRDLRKRDRALLAKEIALSEQLVA